MLVRRTVLLTAALAALLGFYSWAGSAWRRRPLDSALVKAAKDYDLTSVKLLLHQGANPNVKNEAQVSLAAAALLDNKLNLAEILLEGGAQVDMSFCLLEAAGDRSPDVVRLLLERGADVNTRDARRRTPLMRAAALPGADDQLSGSAETIRALLSANADIRAVDQEGRTALAHAAQAGNYKTARLLLENGADMDAADRAGVTPLMLAAESRSDAVLQLLLTRGANIQNKDRAGKTALDYAKRSALPSNAHRLRAAAAH